MRSPHPAVGLGLASLALAFGLARAPTPPPVADPPTPTPLLEVYSDPTDGHEAIYVDIPACATISLSPTSPPDLQRIVVNLDGCA